MNVDNELWTRYILCGLISSCVVDYLSKKLPSNQLTFQTYKSNRDIAVQFARDSKARMYTVPLVS